MQSFSIRRRVIAQALRLLSDGGDICGFAGMEDRGDHESLTERGLEISADDCMYIRCDIAELEIETILQVFRLTGSGSSELSSEDHTALIIKPIAELREHRIGAFESFYISCVYARDYFMLSVREDFAGVEFFICDFRFMIYDLDEGEKIADFVVGERGDKAKFV